MFVLHKNITELMEESCRIYGLILKLHVYIMTNTSNRLLTVTKLNFSLLWYFGILLFIAKRQHFGAMIKKNNKKVIKFLHFN